MVMGDAARVTDGSDLRMNLEDDLMIVCRCLMIARCVKLKRAVLCCSLVHYPAASSGFCFEFAEVCRLCFWILEVLTVRYKVP